MVLNSRGDESGSLLPVSLLSICRQQSRKFRKLQSMQTLATGRDCKIFSGEIIYLSSATSEVIRDNFLIYEGIKSQWSQCFPRLLSVEYFPGLLQTENSTVSPLCCLSDSVYCKFTKLLNNHQPQPDRSGHHRLNLTQLVHLDFHLKYFYTAPGEKMQLFEGDMQRITFLILKTSKSKDQGLFCGKIIC